MRFTAGDVVRKPSRFADWWYELPARHWYWWREVLVAPGGGWLAWKREYAEDWDYIDGYRYDAGGQFVYPPVRRVWIWLRCHIEAPFRMMRGYEVDGSRHRLSWEEVVCSFSDIPRDPERERLFR